MCLSASVWIVPFFGFLYVIYVISLELGYEKVVVPWSNIEMHNKT